eukprot:GDKI01027024.1.p1 GENE.GDKI01027024.1~~GDKI01027024.1.p1  ORF type:complete len:460 (-),score=161.58 GDKI01027024.1:76-1404(-)
MLQKTIRLTGNARSLQAVSHFVNGNKREFQNGAKIAPAAVVTRTKNPIRELVDKMSVKPNPEKKMIPLSIGDPTIFGNFNTPAHIEKKMHEVYASHKFDGYAHSSGYPDVREAVAKKSSPPNPNHKCSADDVVLTSGCSQALEFAIAALANPITDTVLVPRPGFPLYATLCASKGINYKHYDLDPNRSWEIDIPSLEKVIYETKASGQKVAALLINNPSNPTGYSFSKQHIMDILKVAEKNELPVIADEIYANMVFPGTTYHSFASLSENVPILETGGLAKQYMVPGWRMGWVVAHDRHNALTDVKKGLQTLATITLGPCSLIQALVPSFLNDTPKSYLDDTMKQLEVHADTINNGLKDAHGLRVIRPNGTMYAMVEIDTTKINFPSDVEFCKALLQEEAVFCLPGQCFQYPNYFRIVTTVPVPQLEEAMGRIREFCLRHKK